MRTSEYIKKYDLKNGFSLNSHQSFLDDFYFDFQSNVEIRYDTVSEFTESKFWDVVSVFREKFESIFNKCPVVYPEHIWNKFRDDYVPIVLFDFFPQMETDIEKIKMMEYVDLYKYMFQTLSMGEIIGKNKYIPRPTRSRHMGIFGGDYGEVFTNSPDEYFLESIIKICDELLDYQLYYLERVSCERFASWSENKLNVVRNINKKKEEERRSRYSYSSGAFSFGFNDFFYQEFKKRIFENLLNSLLGSDIDSFFKTLNIEVTKDKESVKKAYKELAIRYHPDKIGNSKENHERMVDINVAKTKCLAYCES